jgi:hypothetical protein
MGAGSRPVAQHSSQTPNATRPLTAGQYPSRAGYGSGSGRFDPPTRRARPPTSRPTARHGLSSRKTSPNSSETNGIPTQKTT